MHSPSTVVQLWGLIAIGAAVFFRIMDPLLRILCHSLPAPARFCELRGVNPINQNTKSMPIQRLITVCLFGAVLAACEPGEPVSPKKTSESAPTETVPEAYSPGEDLSAETRSVLSDAPQVLPPPQDMPQDYAPPAEEAGTFGDHDGPAMEELLSTEPPDDVPMVDESMPDNAMPNGSMSEDLGPNGELPDVQEQDTAAGVARPRQ